MSIGERVAAARVAAGQTQEDLATQVGIQRSALAKIETGDRRVSALELVAIAQTLGRSVEWFVEPGPPALVSYRQSRSGLATQPIDDELDRIARDVEFVINESPGLADGQPEPFPTPATISAADSLAAEARRLLGLDPQEPTRDLSRLVTTIGLLPFSVRLGEGADAATVLLGAGGVSVINGDQKVGRRRLALAHELGHYLVADQYTLDWRVAATEADEIEARLDRFARALLLPEADLRERWAEWSAIPDEVMRDTAVRAGSHYQVDMATLARRLTELGLVDQAKADRIRAVRTTKADIEEKNLLPSQELAPVSLPRSYTQAVLRLYRREVVTLDRALGLLLGTFGADDLPELPPANEAEIWAFTS
ncbi:helix-turn-helix domain-containing protein [Micromonospora sp. LOL_021]|uniref:helix-turn-helix domain-containing protein n=1 Tax=Micromonospora sp. LOL_021 TaxID=3345417 RepID=UPI003A8781F7